MFKVGDIVRAKPASGYGITCDERGFRGEVMKVYAEGGTDYIKVKVIGHNDRWCIDHIYSVYPKDFILDVEHFLIKFVEETLNLERK